MHVAATAEAFETLIVDGTVFVDFWWPRCRPC